MSKRIEELKRDRAEWGGVWWADTDIVDAATGEVVARAGEEIAAEDIDHVLHLVLEDDNSIWTVIDDGIFVADECEKRED